MKNVVVPYSNGTRDAAFNGVHAHARNNCPRGKGLFKVYKHYYAIVLQIRDKYFMINIIVVINVQIY